MTEDELREILDDEEIECKLHECKDDNAMLGLLLIRKYIPTAGIGSAEHDQIWSADLAEVCKAGITKEDAIRLKELNWMEDCDSLSCFV